MARRGTVTILKQDLSGITRGGYVPNAPDKARVGRSIQKAATAAALKMAYMNAALETVTKAQDDARYTILNRATTNYDADTQFLAAQTALPDHLRDLSEKVIENNFVEDVMRIQKLAPVFDRILDEALSVVHRPDFEWVRPTFGERMRNFGEDRLKEEHGITLSLGESIANALLPGVVVDSKRRKADRQKEQVKVQIDRLVAEQCARAGLPVDAYYDGGEVTDAETDD